MKKEDQQMKDMGVFELVEQPSGKQILNSLWVLVIKVDDETGQETKKARWVVDGSCKYKISSSQMSRHFWLNSRNTLTHLLVLG